MPLSIVQPDFGHGRPRRPNRDKRRPFETETAIESDLSAAYDLDPIRSEPSPVVAPDTGAAIANLEHASGSSFSLVMRRYSSV